MTTTPDSALDKALVLVVDDDDIERILIREALEKAGFSVEEASNGHEAVAAARDLQPDIVFLDVFMPEMDGFEACAAIRHLPDSQHVPILMVTGADDTESIQQAFDAGATDFMAKPINWLLLGHRVRYIRRASQAFRESIDGRAELAEAQKIAQLGSWQLDIQADLVRCSSESRQIFGWEAEAAPISYASFLDRVHADDRDSVRSAIEDALAANRQLDFDFRILRSDGSVRNIAARAKIVKNSANQCRLLKGTLQDITERKQTEAKLNHLAHHDALTDLPNRVLFHDRLEHALARAARDHSLVAVHCLDLDQFKEINDTLGHAVGDRLLESVADRLLAEVRGADTVARLGGDEFAIIQAGFARPENVAILASRLIASLSRPFNIDGHEILISASAGITLFPADADNPDQLLVNADIAMYRAKAEGRNCYRFFIAGMDDAIRARKKLEHDLRRGLEEGWFEIHYQPQVVAESGAVIGAESLLRMRHPERGLLLPQDFISLAEDTGLIVPIGTWTLRTACAQAARWHADGKPMRIAVNLSPIQFRQAGLVTTVRSALQEVKLAPNYLELEITESMLMHDTASALDLLQQLRQLGVRIAMDDFGTGYSSLSYLKRFALDKLKIDREFIRDIGTDNDDDAIIMAIIAMAHSLGLSVTAEGVETSHQLDFLRQKNCNLGQGYLFSKPLSADNFAGLLLEQDPLKTTLHTQ